MQLAKQITTPLAAQCCLVCGRTLTDRKAHEALEEQVLKSIRDEHPEWANRSGACEPCISHYRQILKERATREERVLAASRRQWPRFVIVFSTKVISLFGHKEKGSRKG